MTASPAAGRARAPRALSRLFSAVLLAVILVAVSSATAGRGSQLKQPNKLLILSTSDVKGKTGPCG